MGVGGASSVARASTCARVWPYGKCVRADGGRHSAKSTAALLTSPRVYRAVPSHLCASVMGSMLWMTRVCACHCTPTPAFSGRYGAPPHPQLDITPEALALGEMFEDVPRSGGWDRTILNGNCVMISLDFWFSSLVQRFVQLCRASGGSVMYRWNEQAVLGMVAQIFASQEQLLMFTFPYAHRCANVVS